MKIGIITGASSGLGREFALQAFEYYDLDETLLIDKGETITFDSTLGRDEVPGIYTVKIADTANGKVTAGEAGDPASRQQCGSRVSGRLREGR